MTEPENSVSTHEGGIWAVSSRGATKGQILVPHKNQRGKYAGAYIVSMTRFEDDYIPVHNPDELKNYVTKGYSVRMSPRDRAGAPNLIKPESISGWR